VSKFIHDTAGVAAVEFAMILPVLVTLLLGIVDSGNALLLKKKLMTSSQIVADLVTRNRNITDAQITDSIAGARMAIAPFSTTPLGVDIVSIQFTGTTNPAPSILWRETSGGTLNPDVLTIASGLGVAGEGVVIVTTTYRYNPVFLGGMIGTIDMEEVAVTRGRRGPLVNRVN
jgi:Flp pilus assembly protein TadG